MPRVESHLVGLIEIEVPLSARDVPATVQDLDDATLGRLLARLAGQPIGRSSLPNRHSDRLPPAAEAERLCVHGRIPAARRLPRALVRPCPPQRIAADLARLAADLDRQAAAFQVRLLADLAAAG